MNWIMKIRLSLIGCWIASCVLAWFFRDSVLALTGLVDQLQHAPLSEQFRGYSRIELVARCLQGALFFALISGGLIMKSLSKLGDFKED